MQQIALQPVQALHTAVETDHDANESMMPDLQRLYDIAYSPDPSIRNSLRAGVANLWIGLHCLYVDDVPKVPACSVKLTSYSLSQLVNNQCLCHTPTWVSRTCSKW